MGQPQADPTRVHIGELDHTKNEPLAIKLRYMLRKKGVRCVGVALLFVLWAMSCVCVHRGEGWVRCV